MSPGQHLCLDTIKECLTSRVHQVIRILCTSAGSTSSTQHCHGKCSSRLDSKDSSQGRAWVLVIPRLVTINLNRQQVLIKCWTTLYHLHAPPCWLSYISCNLGYGIASGTNTECHSWGKNCRLCFKVYGFHSSFYFLSLLCFSYHCHCHHYSTLVLANCGHWKWCYALSEGE